MRAFILLPLLFASSSLAAQPSYLTPPPAPPAAVVRAMLQLEQCPPVPPPPRAGEAGPHTRTLPGLAQFATDEPAKGAAMLGTFVAGMGTAASGGVIAFSKVLVVGVVEMAVPYAAPTPLDLRVESAMIVGGLAVAVAAHTWSVADARRTAARRGRTR